MFHFLLPVISFFAQSLSTFLYCLRLLSIVFVLSFCLLWLFQFLLPIIFCSVCLFFFVSVFVYFSLLFQILLSIVSFYAVFVYVIVSEFIVSCSVFVYLSLLFSFYFTQAFVYFSFLLQSLFLFDSVFIVPLFMTHPKNPSFLDDVLINFTTEPCGYCVEIYIFYPKLSYYIFQVFTFCF